MALPNISNALEGLHISNANHAEELMELKAKHKREFDALRLLWDKDREELRNMEAEITALRKEKEHLAGENEVLRQNQAVTGSDDADACKKNPLFMKGVETRLRLWELNKMALYDTRYEDLNMDIIERGNIAAHHQDIQSDIALFAHGYLSEETESATFEKTYKLSLEKSRNFQLHLPHDSHSWFKGFCAVVDSVATINMNIPQDSQTRQSIDFKQYCDLHIILREQVMQDVEVDGKEICKLQKLVAKVVGTERKNNRRH